MIDRYEAYDRLSEPIDVSSLLELQESSSDVSSLLELQESSSDVSSLLVLQESSSEKSESISSNGGRSSRTD
jgi:hypothetical protein